MKKLISYISSWSLFWFGHFVSLLMSNIPALYPTYRWCMFTSMEIQDWAENKTPWKHIENKNERTAI